MSQTQASTPPATDSVALSVLIGLLICMAVAGGMTRDVWTTGAFFDTDDATRMVQVRDWMAGQSWYDLNMHRLGLAGAEPMHWTRLVDAPIALLVKAASLFLDGEMAERAARIAFPFLLTAGLLWVGALVAIELMGGASVLSACVCLALAGLSLLQFQPGRIDHHAPQILLLAACGLFALRALRPQRAGVNGCLCALCVSASMGVSLENLPAGCMVSASFAGVWAAQGKMRASALRGYGFGLLTAMPAIYAATVAPARWLVPACDAQSVLHVSLGALGGLACIALAAAPRTFDRPGARWLALAASGLALALTLRTVFPQCGLDPYAGVDSLVREEWLDKVREAFSLPKAWSRGMTTPVLVNFAPALFGLCGLAYAVFRTRGEARLRWSLWLALTATTGAVAGFRFGYVQTFQAFAAFGAAFLVSLAPRPWRGWAMSGVALASVVGLTILAPADESAALNARKNLQCIRPLDAQGLAALPQARVLSPIDEGAYLLAFTGHQIVTAPYHRNHAGNRLAAEAFTLPAADALRLLRAHGVDIVAICGDERRSSPLIESLTAGLPNVAKLDLPGRFDVWRIAP